MATLRELLVKIAFQVDNGGMKKLEQTTSQTLKRIEGMFGISEKKVLQGKKKTDEQKKKSDFTYTQWWASQLNRREKLEEQALRRSTKIAEQNANKKKQALEKNAKIGLGVTGNVTGGILAGIGAFGAGAVVAGGAIIRLNDAMNMSIARIGVLSGDMSTARDRFKELLGVSNETGQSIDTLSSLFGRIILPSKEYNLSLKQQMDTLKTVAKLAQLGGKNQSSIDGGLLQLGQALGSATVQADEYRSIAEQLPALHTAIAKSIGLTPTKLQLWIKNARTTGSITGKELFEAILKATAETETRFDKLPLTFQRVMNQAVNTFTELGLAMEDKLTPVNAFIEGLQDRVMRLKDYILANKEPIGKAIEKLFEGFNKFLNLMEGAIPLVAPTFNFLVDHFDDIVAIVGGLLSGLVVLNAFFLYTLIPTLIATGTAFGLAFPEIRLIAIIATITAVVVGLIIKFDLLNKAIKGVGDAWNAISSKFSEITDPVNWQKGKKAIKKIRESGQVNPLTGGYVGEYVKRKSQAQAQSQGAGSGKQFVSSTTNVGGSTLNFTSPVSQPQAEKIGMGLMSGITRGLVALETMA